MGKTRAQIAARRKTPPPAGVPAAAPMRPVAPDEVETARVKKTDPHRTGVDRTPVLKVHVSAARQRAMHKAAHGKLPTAPKPVAKAAAKTAPKAKAKKKAAAAKPAAATELY